MTETPKKNENESTLRKQPNLAQRAPQIKPDSYSSKPCAFICWIFLIVLALFLLFGRSADNSNRIPESPPTAKLEERNLGGFASSEDVGVLFGDEKESEFGFEEMKEEKKFMKEYVEAGYHKAESVSVGGARFTQSEEDDRFHDGDFGGEYSNFDR